MNPLRITISALAVWRVTHLLLAEDGPFDMFEHGRRYLRRTSLAGLANCFYCMSLWVAAPFAFTLGSLWEERMTLCLALSGAAILINRFSEIAPPAALFYEEPYQEEKPKCSVVEMPEDSCPRIHGPIQGPSQAQSGSMARS